MKLLLHYILAICCMIPLAMINICIPLIALIMWDKYYFKFYHPNEFFDRIWKFNNKEL